MKIILIVAYVLLDALTLIAGVMYPAVSHWSYLASGVFGYFLILSLVAAFAPMAEAGRMAVWGWNGVCSLIIAGLFYLGDARQENGWLLAGIALGLLCLLVTVVVCLVLKPGGSAVGPAVKGGAGSGGGGM